MTSYGEMRWSIQVVRRVMVTPLPFQADVDHTYTPVITVRADCDTSKGVQNFNRVNTDMAATHVFTIRYTTIPFDIRDRVRDSLGNLYTILSVENVKEGRMWLKIVCALAGKEERRSIT
jgi:Phage head-tail joining protein